jgi:hypothetical protein
LIYSEVGRPPFPFVHHVDHAVHLTFDLAEFEIEPLFEGFSGSRRVG